MTYYKILGSNGEPCNGGSGEWFLPRGSRPSKWMPKIDNVEPCQRGYHLCRPSDLIHWLNARIYEAEIDPRGELVEQDDKVVVSRARLTRRVAAWNDRTARLFAVDCAARVLPLVEKHCPKDKRPREAIRVARLFANDKATIEQLAAARAAAEAAGAAARAAAEAAAEAAVERKWQTKRLLKYLNGERS